MYTLDTTDENTTKILLHLKEVTVVLVNRRELPCLKISRQQPHSYQRFLILKLPKTPFLINLKRLLKLLLQFRRYLLPLILPRQFLIRKLYCQNPRQSLETRHFLKSRIYIGILWIWIIINPSRADKITNVTFREIE